MRPSFHAWVLGLSVVAFGAMPAQAAEASAAASATAGVAASPPAVEAPPAAPAAEAQVSTAGEAAPSEAPAPETAPSPLEAPLSDSTAEAAAPPSEPATAPTAEPVIQAPAASGERSMRAFREMEGGNWVASSQPAALLEWHGNGQLDAAYARYTFSNDSLPGETLYDVRGRVVVGPTLTYQLGGGFFAQARAEVVGWVREAVSAYQVNVDDVYGRFGQQGYWDVSVGRFLSWRVFHRGRGFDLFTLEELGACATGSCASQDPARFAPHMYEVNSIYMRDTPGRAAIHIYPTSWSGIEILGQYGNTGQPGMSTPGSSTIGVPVAPAAPAAVPYNTLGGRLALTAFHPNFRVSAAGEYRHDSPTVDQTTVDASTNTVVACPTCLTASTLGVGGGVEVKLPPYVELGANFAWSATIRRVTTSADQDLSGTAMTMGGYLEVNPLGFIGKTLIVGAGVNWTQVNSRSDNYDSHDQEAIYLAYPLGFNDAEVKLVASNAFLERVTGGTFAYSQANALRLRYVMSF